MNGATGNEIASVVLINRSGSACYLDGYPGVELLDAASHHLANARWTTTSFFGTYPPPHRVNIEPGGATSFDLTWGGIDPCGNAPALHPAYLRITPPDDFDAVTISATPPSQTGMDVCPNSMDVHPVGSRPQQ
jgi:Protein of unknown function (DUF4232)